MCHPPCLPPRATGEELPRGAGSRSNHVSLCVIFYSGNASSEGSLLGDEGKIMTKCCKPGAPARGSGSSQTCLVPPATGPPPGMPAATTPTSHSEPHRQHSPAGTHQPPCLGASHRDLVGTWPPWLCRHTPAPAPISCWWEPSQDWGAAAPGSLTEGEQLRSLRVGAGPGSAGTDPDRTPNRLPSPAAPACPTHRNPGSTSTEVGAAQVPLPALSPLTASSDRVSFQHSSHSV